MDIIVPQVGESIVKAEIGKWFKKNGEYVEKDDLLLELETEKVNVELNAEASGMLIVLAGQGETIKIGAVIGKIDETATASSSAVVNDNVEFAPAPAAEPAPMNPAVPKLAAERGVEPATLTGSGHDGRIIVDDIPPAVEAAAKPVPIKPAAASIPAPTVQSILPVDTAERITRVPMSQLQKKIAEHLLQVKQDTAMLTTFNEIDMSRVMAVCKTYKESFQERGLFGFYVFLCQGMCRGVKKLPGGQW